MVTTDSPAKLFSALSQEIRLRILMILDQAELSVAELTEVLDEPQSTVSRQLTPLRELELVESRKQGTWNFYTTGPAMRGEGIRTVLRESFELLSSYDLDKRGLQRVLEARRKRSQDYFNERAGFYGHGKEPGGGFEAIAGAFVFGFDELDVFDLGCGEGALSLLLAQAGAQVTAVDSAPNMVEFVRLQAQDLKYENLQAMLGELEDLPMPDDSADVVIMSQALHHVAQPQRAIHEARRVLRPGGRLIILDLESHDHEDMRMEFGDQWLGFTPEELTKWLDNERFINISVRHIKVDQPPHVLLASARSQ